MKKKLIGIGNAMAGMRKQEDLLKIAPDRYDATVAGAEQHNNYAINNVSTPKLDKTGYVQSYHLFGAA